MVDDDMSLPPSRPVSPRSGLTQEQVAAIFQRAAELDAAELVLPASDRFDPASVEAAAVEVGLSQRAVRRAMSEVLHADTDPVQTRQPGRGLTPRTLSITRQLPGPADEVADALKQFLRSQLFFQQRIFGERTRWAPQRSWAASIRKGIDPSGRFVLKQVRRVDLSVEPDAEGTDSVVVTCDLDVSSVRSTHSSFLAGGAVSGGLIVGATGIAVGFDPLLVAAIPVAGGAVAGGHLLGRHAATRELEAIHTAVAGVLDRIEYPHHDSRARRGRPKP